MKNIFFVRTTSEIIWRPIMGGYCEERWKLRKVKFYFIGVRIWTKYRLYRMIPDDFIFRTNSILFRMIIPKTSAK
jgi:hypothetical protein